MPEGHTIHRIARDHGRLLAGTALAVSSPQGRFEAGAERVDGHVLDRIEAYGKHLWYWFDNSELIHVHLGLFGKYRVARTSTPPEVRGAVRMRMSNAVVTVDLAGPTACELATPEDRASIVARLGPDPLQRDADPQRFVARVSRSKAPIGLLLMDQSVVAGVGNVFRAEALFVNGIDPERPGRSLTVDEIGALWSTITAMLRQGVKDNRIITLERADLDRPRSRSFKRGESTYVYKRRDCLRCDSPIRWWDMSGRTCYACPTCQTPVIIGRG